MQRRVALRLVQPGHLGRRAAGILGVEGREPLGNLRGHRLRQRLAARAGMQALGAARLIAGQPVIDRVPTDAQLARGGGGTVLAREVDQAHLLGKRQPAPSIVWGGIQRGNRRFLIRWFEPVPESAYDNLARFCHPTQQAAQP
jgi:hypothetical protein